MPSIDKTHTIFLYNSGKWQTEPVLIPQEEPVTLTVNGEPWITFMCTPNDLDALAVGFLYNEGIINTATEVASCRVCTTGENVDIWLHHSMTKPKSWQRTSGCMGGVTAVNHTEALSDTSTIAPAGFTGWKLLPEEIFKLVDDLFNAQQIYRQSGGVHTSALSDGQALIVVAEDIGRHNTIDKIAGRCVLSDIHLPQPVLISTGRISSEMLQKSSRLGVVMIISRTAPSSLAVKLAKQQGITLIGYVRRNRFTVYSHVERVSMQGESTTFKME